VVTGKDVSTLLRHDKVLFGADLKPKCHSVASREGIFGVFKCRRKMSPDEAYGTGPL